MTLVGWLLLLVVLAFAGAYAASRRRPKLPGPTVPRVSEGSDDLGSLGLSEVRPAGPRAARPEEEARRPESVSAARPVSPRPAEPASPAPSAGARPVTLPTVPRGDEPARPKAATHPGPATRSGTPWADPAVAHLLASLAGHVGGGVAIVRHDGRQHLVEARTDGGSLVPVDGRRFDLDGDTWLASDALGGLAGAVGARARAIPVGDAVLLIGGDADAADPYFDLLELVLPESALEPSRPASARASAEAPERAPEVDDVDEMDDFDLGDEEAAEAAPVPRATIIAEEQAEARDAERPLAFALVTLADAEERLTGHAPEAVARAEAELRERLETAPDVRRIEPFGDLLFGVFLALAPAGAAAWCDRLASGDPPLFIGAVAPADGDPTDVRNAAARALHDAYDQKRTRVVEA
ncbi:hypothetical protein BSZ37_18845 [Rubrivirga marina]|uniref:GGDEF domain-containing protein n=1 Tax=Rubrivirga marina TaxID=1196024 RepID=A0A271J477_9BACT|nr:hypothetical protein BSZ37_18845 [Rubrivirga marina]